MSNEGLSKYNVLFKKQGYVPIEGLPCQHCGKSDQPLYTTYPCDHWVCGFRHHTPEKCSIFCDDPSHPDRCQDCTDCGRHTTWPNYFILEKGVIICSICNLKRNNYYDEYLKNQQSLIMEEYFGYE